MCWCLAGGWPHGLRAQDRGLAWRRGLEASACRQKAAGRSICYRRPDSKVLPGSTAKGHGEAHGREAGGSPGLSGVRAWSVDSDGGTSWGHGGDQCQFARFQAGKGG